MLLCNDEKLIDYEKLLPNILIIMLYNMFENFGFYENKGETLLKFQVVRFFFFPFWWSRKL